MARRDGVATAWAVTAEGLFVLVMAVGGFRAALDKPADEPDSGALFSYIAPVAVLSALILSPVHLPGRGCDASAPLDDRARQSLFATRLTIQGNAIS
jgi:hypothetical protein